MIINNKTAYEALMLKPATNAFYDTQIREKKLPFGWFWTRTIIAYRKHGNKLGRTISLSEYGETWKINVPRKYQGRMNVCLLADINPDEVKKDWETINLSPKSLRVKRMPKKNGYHLPDEFGFPSGKPSKYEDEKARHLYRRDSDFVGVLSRYCDDGCDRRYVYAGVGAVWRCGVLTESIEKADLKMLAKDAKKALEKMRGVVDKTLLAPVEKLVEATKI